MTEESAPVLTCSECGDEIDCCALCEGEDCRIAICYEHLREATGQAMPQPHEHGG
jgi:hypothetical protein